MLACRQKKETTAPSYHMNSHLLENVTEEKDLGVIVDNKIPYSHFSYKESEFDTWID